MKTQHTPSPWKHDDTWVLIKHGKTEICAFHSGNLANAHLISAAPDLLSALQQMLNADYAIQEGFGEKSDQAMMRISAIDSAHRAIAKAKGEA